MSHSWEGLQAPLPDQAGSTRAPLLEEVTGKVPWSGGATG